MPLVYQLLRAAVLRMRTSILSRVSLNFFEDCFDDNMLHLKYIYCDKILYKVFLRTHICHILCHWI